MLKLLSSFIFKFGNYYDVASLMLDGIPIKNEDDEFVPQEKLFMKFSLKGCAEVRVIYLIAS